MKISWKFPHLVQTIGNIFLVLALVMAFTESLIYLLFLILPIIFWFGREGISWNEEQKQLQLFFRILGIEFTRKKFTSEDINDFEVISRLEAETYASRGTSSRFNSPKIKITFQTDTKKYLYFADHSEANLNCCKEIQQSLGF